MQRIPIHIAYLLTKHECVIIPGLGAFIASEREVNRSKQEGIFCPPANFLGFNPDIRHNDGLLANSLAKGSTISYKEACLQIHHYVDQVNQRLENHQNIQIPWVGRLELSAGHKIIFTPVPLMSCNAGHFGLYPFYLPALSELEESHQQPVISDVIYIPVNRQIIRRIGSVAAAALALFLVSTPLTDQSQSYPQLATMISIPAVTPAENRMVEEVAVVNTEEPASVRPEEVIPANSRYYYIVIAGRPTEKSAKEQVTEYQKTGFPTAAIISAGTKHRIYIDKFADKRKAEMFLDKFRAEHPEYQDAWLLSQ
jgi:nucleoid DNA-binding protein